MGDSRVNLDNFDSLDYLIPSVKKSKGALETDLLFSRDFKKQADFRLFKDFSKKIRKSDVQASVILNKKTGQLIHEHLSVVNSVKKCFPFNKECRKNCKSEDKPMIHVTVIPKAVDGKASKVFNKRCERSKKLQCTVSNQESSIKSLNNYFMVKGKKHKKVYTIKSTESTNLSNSFFKTNYKDISIQQITNSKHLINSLEMEKKKRKNIKIEPNNDMIKNFSVYNSKNYEESEGVNTQKNKVTIVGQLGLTRDDKYVLKCAATVDDKPIATNYVRMDSDTKRNLSNINQAPVRQDSNVQTDICYENNCIYLQPNRKGYRNTTQATQVNFNQPRYKPLKAFKNKVAQCKCDISTTESNIFNVGTQDNMLKGCKSPLVIISVYPRQNDKDNKNSTVKIIPQPTSKNVDFSKTKAIKEQQMKNNRLSVSKSDQRSVQSRSASPPAKNVPTRTLLDKTLYLSKNNTNKRSPQSMQRKRNKNSENKSKHRLNKLKKDVSCNCPYSFGLENQDFIKLGLNSNVYDTQESDAKQVKRALVNSFMKSIGTMDGNDKKVKLISPKVDTSKVTINIEGDKDQYDVLLEQSNFDTGLSVRKTLKKQSKIRSIPNEVNINSMENFLMLSEETKNAPMYSQGTHEISMTVPKEARLNVRDSLEICHSREGRTASRSNRTSSRDKNVSSFNSDFTAPVKHYRGDDCSILDPNERDKEIRQLLGVVRNMRNPKKSENAAPKDIFTHRDCEAPREKACSCGKKCSSKGLMTGLSISKVAKRCLRKTRRQNNGISITSRTLLQKREAKKMEKQETQALYKKIKVSKDFETSSDTLFGKLSVENERYDKQEIHKFQNKSETAKVPHKQSFIKQNLILNRNVQVFLQLEEFTKEKPIVLTQRQYEKVKRTIQCTINQRKLCNLNNFNIVSVGEIKVKQRLQKRIDREIQTEPEIQRIVRCIQIQTQRSYKLQKVKKPNTKQNESKKSETYEKLTTGNIRKNNTIIFPTKNNNEKITNTADSNFNKQDMNKDIVEKHLKPYTVTPRQTVSSMEIHFANVAFRKNITVSSAQFGDGLHNKIQTKPSTSLHTIFKGHRKSATPNLGTSAYSLCSDANDFTKSIIFKPCAGDSKPKKPFLQRLLSCLVMRSTETTVIRELPKQNLPSVNSSVDSYHLSTSLGAIEMTSTLYDTSASFFSNHTIAPVNKMKRGFFNSVRGFLTTRRN